MSNWIEVKVRYEKLQGNGTSVKKVTEAYLVDAVNFTEAEARITKERAPYMSGEFIVSAAKKTKIADIIYGQEERWWNVKCAFISIDERPCAKGLPPKEKKVKTESLVQGANLQEALDNFNGYMKGTLADYEVVAVAESPILEVYKTEI